MLNLGRSDPLALEKDRLLLVSKQNILMWGSTVWAVNLEGRSSALVEQADLITFMEMGPILSTTLQEIS